MPERNRKSHSPLDRRVQFRSLGPGGGRSKSRHLKIPPDMIAALQWNSEWPIRIEANEEARTMTLSQVDPATEDLVRENLIWREKRR